MSSTTIVTLAIAVLMVLGLGVVLTASRRSDTSGVGSLSRETRKRDRSVAKNAILSARQVESQASMSRSTTVAVLPSAEIAPWVAPDAEALGVTRRAFLNRATVTLMSASLAGFAASLIAFLWKGAEGGFGSKVTAGKIDDVIGQIRSGGGFLYMPEARAWVTEYPKEAISKAEVAYGKQGSVFAGMSAGVVALYQKCPHLGCRVPNCITSQWFECPCHGSQYNRVGEKKGGPAPRGMDHFGVSVNNGIMVIDTGAIFGGAPIGTNTTGQEAEGPHCIGLTGGH
ncbi:MAG: Rieske 2Fe-2S domain-containing protein [Acidimicrobiaceae bacterium]|nr:Rieske 2Fe-2S domain-containing protein [Acidimicrobiaceae bacterium]